MDRHFRRPTAGPNHRDRNQFLLLIGLGVDNFGSGLFLPLSVLYTTQAIGLPLGLAGSALTLGALVGLVVPPFAGRFVDRVGPRTVLITSQLIQAGGAFGFLVAHGFLGVVLASALLAVGQQMFYCSVFAMIADVAATDDKDRAFALANMVRSAGFGLGALVVGALLLQAGKTGFQIAIIADGLSFLVVAALLRTVTVTHERGGQEAGPGSVLRDRPYLALIVMTGLAVLAVDFFLVGSPSSSSIGSTDRPGCPGWPWRSSPR